MLLYVYIMNIFIYSSTRSVLGSVPVRFGYFGYKNIETVRVFEDIDTVLVSGISVRFRFGSSVPVISVRKSQLYIIHTTPTINTTLYINIHVVGTTRSNIHTITN